MSMLVVQYKMHYKILPKLGKAGAISEEKAVIFAQADLDFQEQCWLDYFVGTFLGRIKKTKVHRYYI